MSEILGLGITHYPALTAGKASPVALRRLLQDPGLPGHYRTPVGWPEMMQREWGKDEGASFAEMHRQHIIGEIRKLRAELDAFRPDFVLVWGDDHYENFQEDLIPGFCVLAYDDIDVQPWSKLGTPPNAWGEEPDTTFRIRGHKEGAKYLVSKLIEQNFDLAYAYRPLHVQLGHAFINTVLFLDWDRKGFDFPLVPFAVNCYGRRIIATRGHMETLQNPIKERDFDPPSPSPARCFDLGAATARILAQSPWRVAVVASSSWSHAFMTRKHSFLYPDTDADRVLFEALKRGDYQAWCKMTLSQIEDSGQHELLNWFCLAGAMSELKRKPANALFIETSIMNSNKVVATFRP